LLIHRYK